MSSALLIRLRPAGPWRYGPGDGARDRVDSLYRSDRLFSAVSQAMLRLGHLDAWLDATARAPHPAVVFSSLFPFQADTLFAPPPQTLWPPAVAALRTPSPVFLTKVRWRTAQFVPVSVIESLMTGSQINADQWIADAESGCLLRRDRPQSSPFRTVVRTRVPVDRITNRSADGHIAACIEFEAGAGLWAVALFGDAAAQSAWSERVQAAFRLLGDTGFGGSRSTGWGQAPSPECQVGDWPGLLFPKLARGLRNGAADELSSLHWLLSVYSPAGDDAVDWAEGKYALTIRGGRVESQAGWGAEKKLVRMVTEGSVVSAGTSPKGQAVDVAPDGFAHPVYRAGFALALQLPVVHIVETPEQAMEEVAETANVPAVVEAAPTHAEVEEAVSTEAVEPTEESQEDPAVHFDAPEIIEQAPADNVEPAEPVAPSEPAEDRVDEETAEFKSSADVEPEIESSIKTPVEDVPEEAEEPVRRPANDAAPETKTGESEVDGHEL
jgi:CRISPR type III-A-associated RAMP protein Csm4